MIGLTIIVYIVILIFVCLSFILFSYNVYNKNIGNLYKIKADVYDEFSNGEQQIKYKQYLLGQIDYNLAYFNTHKIWKCAFALHFIKEWILNDLLKFPSTVEQEDLFFLHINNLKMIGQTGQIPVNLTGVIKRLSRSTSYNYINYLKILVKENK